MTLVISRKRGQKFKIGDDVTVTIAEIRKGHTARIAIDAPASVKIMRTELLDRKDAAATSAA